MLWTCLSVIVTHPRSRYSNDIEIKKKVTVTQCELIQTALLFWKKLWVALKRAVGLSPCSFPIWSILEYIRCSITLECGNSQGRRIFRSGKRVGNTWSTSFNWWYCSKYIVIPTGTLSYQNSTYKDGLSALT